MARKKSEPTTPTTNPAQVVPIAESGPSGPPAPETERSAYRKEKIPKAVREQLWLRDVGEKFYGRCKTAWCRNRVTVWDYQCGHNIPESKGGETTLDNLVVLCSRCNNSMSNNYTFTEWQQKFGPKRKSWFRRLFG